MKNHLRLSLTLLTLSGLAGFSAMTGCTGLPSGTNPSTSPSASESIAPTPDPKSRLNVQFKFTQGTSTAPGTALTFKLKKMLTGETTWSDYQVNNVTATYSTDTNGLASIANLPAGQYQAAFSVDNTVATEEFNAIGTLVTDPATVSATQTTAASITGELYWDFEHNIIPAPNTKPNSGFSFSFNKPLGYSTDAVYQVTVYPSTAMTGGIYTVPSSTTFSTGTTIPAGTGLTSGNQYYYVVKFWKNGGSFGGGNYYGQTKPIPFTAP